MTRSKEFELIMKTFAERQRVHKNKPIYLYRLWEQLKLHNIDFKKFNQVFIELEKEGYGKIHYGRSQKPKLFFPILSVKELASKANETISDPVPVLTDIFASVTFNIGPYACKAKVPTMALDKFLELVANIR